MRTIYTLIIFLMIVSLSSIKSIAVDKQDNPIKVNSEILPPSNFKASIENNQIKLSWAGTKYTNTYFNIYRQEKTLGGQWKNVASLGDSVWYDTTAVFNTTYYYIAKTCVIDTGNQIESEPSDTLNCIVNTYYVKDSSYFYDDFNSLNKTYWVSLQGSFTTNLGPYDSNNVDINSNNYLNLKVIKDSNNQITQGNLNTTQNYKFGYGRYEARIKTSLDSGVCNAFFLYNLWADYSGEIDIEIFCEKQLNGSYYARLGHFLTNSSTQEDPCTVNLNFDPSDDFHLYRFDWYSDRIEWFIDNQLVYKTSKNIPSTPMNIIFENWIGNSNWYWLSWIMTLPNCIPKIYAPGNGNKAVNSVDPMLVDYVRYVGLPNLPYCIAPANDTTDIYFNNIDFKWSLLPNMKKYHLQISTDTSFASNFVIDDSTLTQNTLSINNLFKKDTKYFWRVKGILEDNVETGWSEIYNFSTFSENYINPNNNVISNCITISPNPVKNICNINYSINSSSLVSIEIINIFGQNIKTIIRDKYINCGSYITELYLDDLYSGTYYCKLQTNNQILISKFALIK